MGLKTQIRKMLGRPQPLPTAPPLNVERLASEYPDVPQHWLQTYLDVQPYTMTSPQRVFALCQAVEHVQRCQLPGDLVECGVWRGGSTMAMVQTLGRLKQKNRQIWLYDTFEGMSAPTDSDVDCFGKTATELLDESADRTAADSVWCEASLGDVKANLGRLSYPQDQFHFVAGKVEETLPEHMPDQISILRLDTDWFDSTWHELVHLYPRLVSGGVLIIDDYGHWQGCREAVDQYLSQFAPQLFLNRIDYTGRLAIKP